MMTHCPICQSALVPTQSNPIVMRCPKSYQGNGHLFEFLCWDNGNIHHYKYNLSGWEVTYWPHEALPYVIIRYIENYKVLHAGFAKKNFVDFPAIGEYLKMLAVFS